MKIFKQVAVLMALFIVFGVYSQGAKAHVIDLTKEKMAQIDYKDSYTLVKSYKGESGVVINSYSPKWNTLDKLKALDEELLANKHGKEIAYLGEIDIFPDYPTGNQNVLGQYFAEYTTSSNGIHLSKNRVIQIYGGNDYSTIESVAHTLSHEYGHHFTYYYLIEKEQLNPSQWLSSNYAKARDFEQYSSINTGDGTYEWGLPEILAEDYVQLFGSENGVKDSLQMNTDIKTPFETPQIETYWKNLLGDSYKEKKSMDLFLTGFKKASFYPYYDLQLNLSGGEQGSSYIRGEGEYAKRYSRLLASIPAGKQDVDLTFNGLPYEEKAWMLDGSINKSIKLQAVQHQANGYNTGSNMLNVSYGSISNQVVTKETLMYQKSQEYTMDDKKKMLTEVANEKGIPAEILKAIAFVETDMKQFNDDGTPITTEDGGIGMMQVTLTPEEVVKYNIDLEKLKYDVRYNIEQGADLLKRKWDLSYLPVVNHHDPKHLEDWYFAIMAYNGLSKRNDPTIQGNDPYQERVFRTIRNSSLMEVGQTPVEDIHIRYPNPNQPEIMSFVDERYEWSTETRTAQDYQTGQYVYTLNPYFDYSNLRDSANDGALKMKLPHYTPLEIVAGPFEITDTSGFNQYAMYQVKGINFEGYMASSNMILSDKVKFFTDIKQRQEVASAVTYLGVRDIIHGYQDGSFLPNKELLRRHAAQLLVNALHLTAPSDYKMKATDMKPNDLSYEDMRIAEYHGLMGHGGALRPNEYLSRSQMASILVRAFGKYYANPPADYQYAGIDPGFWNAKDINVIAYNKVTIGNPFKPQTDVTRSQFALFLQRTIVIKEGKE
ncbi:S-layer homology domain-containing protein [Falsibacillus pallidus]|uniref:S-layer homology domain-containing protein n=1 Tax=Falsibacillus pallidus TaxID=493781 RepID=UPI003D9603DF